MYVWLLNRIMFAMFGLRFFVLLFGIINSVVGFFYFWFVLFWLGLSLFVDCV